MSLAGQRIQPERYTVIPRTISFLTQGDRVLLMRLASDRGAWAGKYNGIGGHIEQGEDPLQSARREIEEESGLIPRSLRLVGVVLIDTGAAPGIGLYVFVGQGASGEPREGPEGRPEWVEFEALQPTALVSDLPTLLPAAIESHRSGQPFCGVYEYDDQGKLHIRLSTE
jgi:8-oxo-dGTP diphosphatase